MEHKFQIQTKIQKSAAEVFEAVRDPAQLSRYYASGGSDGPLEEGRTVNWCFRETDGEEVSVPVKVRSVTKDKRICFTWAASEGVYDASTGARPRAGGYDTTVEISFEGLRAGETLVRITEGVWAPTEAGLQGSYQNCQEWMQMACCLKAYLEHGITLYGA